MLVLSKGVHYADRSIRQPVQELTREDADAEKNVIWWVLVRRDYDKTLKKLNRLKKQEAKGVKVTRWPLWAPYMQHFGAPMVERMSRYRREDYDAGEVLNAREELRSLVGFLAYSYRKHELRG